MQSPERKEFIDHNEWTPDNQERENPPTRTSSAAKVDLAALREKHDPVARNLVTVWRSELLALIEVAEAAWAFLASNYEPTAVHARLNAALDRLEFPANVEDDAWERRSHAR